MSRKNFRRIIQQAVRFQNAAEAAEARALEGMDLDAGFDAGEFSGPAAERALLRERDQIAARLGFGSADLAESIIEFLGCGLRKPAHLYFDPQASAPIPQAF